MIKRIINWSALLLGAIVISPLFAPQLLAFPYHRTIGDTTIYAEQPIHPNIDAVMAQSDALLKQSAIYSDSYGKNIFLTDGGWRWNWLANTVRYSLAFTRPHMVNSVVVNSSDIAQDKMTVRCIGKQRRLSDIIAHERTHQLIWAHFGAIKSFTFPAWKVEGYADYVAQNSTLDAVSAAKLKQKEKDHPAIVYFEGRQKVTAILKQNGGSVDKLFE